VLAVELDGETVWVGGKNGLFQVDSSSGDLIQKVSLPVEPIHIRSLEVDPSGDLWIGHVDGLLKITEQGSQSWDKRSGLPANRVNCLLALADSMLVGTSAGIVEVTSSGVQQRISPSSLASPVVNAFYRSKTGALLIGSTSDPEGGLTSIHDGSVQTWGKDVLPHPYIHDICEDHDGALWVATGLGEEGGAISLREGESGFEVVDTLAKADGLAGFKVRSVGPHQGGALWFGSENDGLAVRSEGSFNVITMEDGLPHDEITVIKTDSDGTVWLGTLNGVVRISSEAARRLALG
jgi:ligand-binding sensor domain-containing protein